MKKLLLFSTFACVLFGCTSTDIEKTKTSMGVFLKKEIRIETGKAGEDSVQFADIVEGDSTIFLYSEYTDYGEEGSGHKICFYVDESMDSSAYSQDRNKILIIGFGTGMSPNISDTVKIYDFKVFIFQNSIRIVGNVGDKNITGTYVPK